MVGGSRHGGGSRELPSGNREPRPARCPRGGDRPGWSDADRHLNRNDMSSLAGDHMRSSF